MLKVTGLSLLLGSVALVVVLTQFFAAPEVEGPRPSPVKLNASNALFVQGTADFADGALELRLSKTGRGSVSLATGGIPAQFYPFLHLAIEAPPQDLEITIKLGVEGEKTWSYKLESTSLSSMWLATKELEGWTGTVNSIRLLFESATGQVIHIENLSLYPASPSHQLRAIVSDLTSNTPWKRANMNTHTGVAKVASFYPVPLVLTLLLLATLSYGLLLLLFQGRLKFNWTVVALLFLTCWISLDMIWQNRLLHQVTHSYRSFFGKDTPEKLAVGPDSRLFNFISEVKQQLEASTDTRVFVSSSDLYLGMRGAYYLYPYNVFWSLARPEVPPSQYWRSGDYIVLIQPTTTRFHKGKDLMRTPDNRPRNAELLLDNPAGKLVRLK